MNTEYPLLPGSYSCAYRGQNVAGHTEIFECEIHGRCSLVELHPRLRACCSCIDRRENGIGMQEMQPKLLGDVVETALMSIGITKERVTSWLGVECNCEERKTKLNALHSWARRVISGKVEKAKEYLEEMLA